jgi:hypothetical protein
MKMNSGSVMSLLADTNLTLKVPRLPPMFVGSLKVCMF